MAEEHRPPSATSGKTPLGSGRAVLLAANRKKFKFLIPLFLFGAASLCAASAQRPVQSDPSGYALPGDGGHAYAVAAPRYIPQQLPDYQETEIPTETSVETPTEVVLPTETVEPSPTETPFIELTPTIPETPTETLPPPDTETPAPSETETPTPQDTPTETPTPTGTEIVSRDVIGVPDNDNINNAYAISALPYHNDIDTLDATTAPSDPFMTCGTGSGQQSATVWFTFTAATYEAITLDTTGSDYTTVLAVWRGAPGDLKQVSCSDASSFTVSLVPGPYYIEVAESGDSGNGGWLEFQVSSAAFQGLRADYFNNIDLLGGPIFTRVDPNVDFDWGYEASPAPGVPGTEFGVRWTGRVHAQFSETYTFYVYSSDGVRLWVDGQPLINYWEVQDPADWRQAEIALQAGMDYSIQLEYFQYFDTGVVQLLWSSPSIGQVVIPSAALDYLDVVNSTVVVDGTQPLADGVATSAITVTALDSFDHFVVGEPVYLQASGAGNRINGYSAAPGEWVLIGYSNASGVATGYLASTAAGQKTVLGMVGGLSVGSPVYVTFVSGPVNRISVSHIPGLEGAEADADSYYPSISADGRYAAFLSAASNLSLPEDLGGLRDIFILDTTTNILSPAFFNVDETDTYPSADLEQPEISGDGRYIVFASTAGNLDPNCDSGILSVFVYEIQIGAPGVFTCVSRGLSDDANGPSEHPSISYDGRYVVFASYATNLVAGVTDGRKHVYLYDRNTLTTELISSDSDEIPGNADSDYPSVSANGQSVVFQSYADNLIAGDGNLASDVFLRDRVTGTTIRISEALVDPDPIGASFQPSISSDGTRVSFLSNASNLVSIETYGYWNIFLRDIPSSSTTLISVSSSGSYANNDSYYSKISTDGNHVTFSSLATNLVSSGGGGIEQIYLRDLEDSETIKISVSAGGNEGNAASSAAWVSGDGTRIAYLSAASNLVAGDLSGWTDVFLLERVTPVQAPPNDDFAAALAADPLPYTYTHLISTLGASRASDDPVISCGGSPSQHVKSVWYSISPAESGSLSLSTVGSSYDTVLAIWTGTRGALTEVACNDDSGIPQSALAFYFELGTTYWVEVVQKGATGGGDLVFTVQDVEMPPVVVTVRDTNTDPEIGMTVEAYLGEIYTGTSGVTNDSGEVTFVLPQATYRFRVVKNGTEFWSGYCTLPTCSSASITTSIPTLVSVVDGYGTPQAYQQVLVFTGPNYTGISSVTNNEGWFEITLPLGSYWFRTTLNNRHFWSGAENHCTIPSCELAVISVEYPVTVTVWDTDLLPSVGVAVRAFDDVGITPYFAVTDSQGHAHLSLPVGNYRFRSGVNGTIFWSGETNDCVIDGNVGGCTEDYISTTLPVVVTVTNASDQAEAGILVHAFQGTTFANVSMRTDALGRATFSLPAGQSFRFRADKNGMVFWSSTGDDCEIGSCTAVGIRVGDTVVVSVHDTNSNADVGMPVRAFTSLGMTPYFGITNALGEATFTLPEGDYRFRVGKNGSVFWSSETYDCTVGAGCITDDITTNVPVVVRVQNLNDEEQTNVWVHAFTESGFANLSVRTDSNGRASFTLPSGNYRFRADQNGRSYWSGETYHCTVPTGCTTVSMHINVLVVVTVEDSGTNPIPGVSVRAFDDTVMTNYFAVTDALGHATLSLPEGDYHFRAGVNGTVFWSNTVNDCHVIGCYEDTITTNLPVIVTVRNASGQLEVNRWVHAFDYITYTNLSVKTDALGQASFTLPAGEYRFRADISGREFWSGEVNHCFVPASCTTVDMTVDDTVVVDVHDTGGIPDVGMPVRVFDDSGMTPYFGVTDADGHVYFALPAPQNYRFRVGKNGTVFWSSELNDCSLPGCTSDEIITNVPVVVTVHDKSHLPEKYLMVHAFNESGFANLSVRTDADGLARFTLPNGNYRFRVDKLSYMYWSGDVVHCTVPFACTSAEVETDDSVTVVVHDTYGAPDVGLNVQAYRGTEFLGFSAVTSDTGAAIFILPEGDYHFRVAKNGTAFWSSQLDECHVPGCTSEEITTTFPLTVTVQTVGGQSEVGLPVYAYDNNLYTGYSSVTDSYGRATLTLPYGNYRFMTEKAGTPYWSGSVNHCRIAGCTEITIRTGTALTVSAGLWRTTCALTEFGALKCWGLNGGKVGDGTTENKNVPTNVVGLSSSVQAVSSGGLTVCALTASGGVKCWGHNEYGSVGDGTTDDRLTPVDVFGLTSGVTAISTGDGFTCALTSGGGVKCWGYNGYGELGDGTCSLQSNTPVDVVGLTSGVAAIAAGENHACAILAGGTVKCWGGNGTGQLGDGTYDLRCQPVDVVGLSANAASISMGNGYSCAVTTTGGAKCWGLNASGVLGNGTYDNSPNPTDVVGLTSGVSIIAAGEGNTCALTTTGGLKCWGDNTYYQLREGIGINSNVPVDRLEYPSGIIWVSAGTTDICIVASNHQLTCWGSNGQGEVGNGTFTPVLLPFNLFL